MPITSHILPRSITTKYQLYQHFSILYETLYAIYTKQRDQFHANKQNQTYNHTYKVGQFVRIRQASSLRGSQRKLRPIYSTNIYRIMSLTHSTAMLIDMSAQVQIKQRLKGRGALIEPVLKRVKITQLKPANRPDHFLKITDEQLNKLLKEIDNVQSNTTGFIRPYFHEQQNTNPIADKELDQLINSPLFQSDPVVQKSPPIQNDPLIKSGSLNDPFHQEIPPIRSGPLIQNIPRHIQKTFITNANKLADLKNGQLSELQSAFTSRGLLVVATKKNHFLKNLNIIDSQNSQNSPKLNASANTATALRRYKIATAQRYNDTMIHKSGGTMPKYQNGNYQPPVNNIQTVRNYLHSIPGRYNYLDYLNVRNSNSFSDYPAKCSHLKSESDNDDYTGRRPSEREVLYGDAKNVPGKGLVSPSPQNLALSQAIRNHHHLQNDHEHDIIVKRPCHHDHGSMHYQPPCVYKIKHGPSKQSLSQSKNDPTIFMSDFDFKKYQNSHDRLRYPHQL